MKTNNLIEDIKTRTKQVESWPSRFERLKSKKSVNMAEFCRKYEFHLSWLSRAINFNPLPRWTTINKIEDALEKEGV